MIDAEASMLLFLSIDVAAQTNGGNP